MIDENRRLNRKSSQKINKMKKFKKIKKWLKPFKTGGIMAL